MEAFALMVVLALAQTEDEIIVPVEEAANGHFIVDVSLGGSWMDDILGQDMDAGAFGSIGIGYELGITDTGSLTLELEYSQHNSDADGSFDVFGRSMGKGQAANVAWRGDVQSDVLMLNAMWTQTLFSDDHNGFLVYLGGGIGYADNDGNLDVSITRKYHDSKKSKHVSVDDSGFASQIFGGIGWRFDAHSKVYLGGRYANLGTLNDTFGIKVRSLVVEAGYSYSF